MKMRRLMEDFEKNKKANYEKLHEEEKRDLKAARERNSSYELIATEKSFCPSCNNNLELLRLDDPTKPQFFICFNCKFIGEVGVGPVNRSLKDKEQK